jgi:hypothetical protein
VLAGAWTATGYPDTMEGAVRSGLTAADLLLAERPGSGVTGARAAGTERRADVIPPFAPARPTELPLQEVTA